MENLSTLQIDALREVCNICCGHAATALSRLMGDIQVLTELPAARRMRREELPSLLAEEGPWVWTRLAIEGEIQGTMALILARKDAERMIDLLCPEPQRGADPELACSALCEATNIAASASMNALSRFARLRVTPGVPGYGSGSTGQLMAALASASGEDAVVLSTTLDVRPARFHSQVVLLTREGSLPTLLSALGL
jgi:chemotaxis protein CheC